MPLLKCLGDVDEWIGLFLPPLCLFAILIKEKKRTVVVECRSLTLAFRVLCQGPVYRPANWPHSLRLNETIQTGKRKSGKIRIVFFYMIIDKNWKQAILRRMRR
jgi:hypothetical protein